MTSGYRGSGLTHTQTHTHTHTHAHTSSRSPVNEVIVVVGLHVVLDGGLQVSDPLEGQLQVHLEALIGRLQALDVHFLTGAGQSGSGRGRNGKVTGLKMEEQARDGLVVRGCGFEPHVSTADA